jgi:hypothetical protein
MPSFTASVSADGSSLTDTHVIVTATASATANSDISYLDAVCLAEHLAKPIAEQTAIYDAHIINQAVAILKEQKNFNTKQINGPPDMTFYYTIPNITSTTKTHLYGSGKAESILQTRNELLFSDYSLTKPIGKFTSSSIIYNINNKDSQGIFERTLTRTLYLPKGTISTQLNIPAIQSGDGVFVVPPGTYLSSITCGTDNYLNSSGILSLNVPIDGNTLTVLVYLNPN